MNYEPILQFILAKGVGDAAVKRALSFMQQHPDLSWNELVNDKSILNHLLFNKDEIVSSVDEQKEKAYKMADRLYQNNISIIFENDKSYPQKLKKSLGQKCPPILFVKGNLDLLNKHSVGFCGSRKVSEKGMQITGDCAKQFVENGIVVVSGYAAGTDMSAHKSALEHNGETIFVLAEGILKHTLKHDVKDMLSENNHIFVSQFMPDLTWKAMNAMKRNRIIIGLSDAMILVESGKSGGTFAAGEETLKINHPLFVIDFSQPEVSAEANPYFISKGGIAIRGKNGTPNLKKVFRIILENPNTNTTSIEFGQLKLNIN